MSRRRRRGRATVALVIASGLAGPWIAQGAAAAAVAGEGARRGGLEPEGPATGVTTASEPEDSPSGAARAVEALLREASNQRAVGDLVLEDPPRVVVRLASP